MRIIHYYTGNQVSDDELNCARAVRLEGNQYNFRDEKAWDGITERCDKVVSDNAEIVSAYFARGVETFDVDGFMGVKKKRRAKKTEEVKTDTGGDPESAESEDSGGAVE